MRAHTYTHTHTLAPYLLTKPITSQPHFYLFTLYTHALSSTHPPALLTCEWVLGPSPCSVPRSQCLVCASELMNYILLPSPNSRASLSELVSVYTLDHVAFCLEHGGHTPGVSSILALDCPGWPQGHLVMELSPHCHFTSRPLHLGVRDFMSSPPSSVTTVRKNECHGTDMSLDRSDFCGGMLGVVVLPCQHSWNGIFLWGPVTKTWVIPALEAIHDLRTPGGSLVWTKCCVCQGEAEWTGATHYPVFSLGVCWGSERGEKGLFCIFTPPCRNNFFWQVCRTVSLLTHGWRTWYVAVFSSRMIATVLFPIFYLV